MSTPISDNDLRLLKAMRATPASCPTAAIARDVLYDRRSRIATVAGVLRGLRRLENAGLVVCTGGPHGPHGYAWDITDAGRSALAAGVTASLRANGE